MTIHLLQNTFIQPGNGNLDKWKLKTIVKKFTCKISNRMAAISKRQQQQQKWLVLLWLKFLKISVMAFIAFKSVLVLA